MTNESEDRILALVLEVTAAVRVLVANQEKMQAEQARAAKALGEAGQILTTLDAAIVRILREMQVPMDDEAVPPMPN